MGVGLFCSILPHPLTLIHSQGQQAKNQQLLQTARDCSYFVANFLEIINVSATHIYHSALELSPLSSITRKLYHHQRLNPSPKVILGNNDLWAATRVISSNQPYYLSSTWSPCSKFIAGVTEEVIEIWDANTFTLFSTLCLTKVGAKFRQGLAYSLGGLCLASYSSAGIIIWDVQTGGELTTIGCEVADGELELAWLDRKTIGTISPLVKETIAVNMYDIASGTRISTATLPSRYKPYIWAEGKSLRVATMAQGHKGWSIDIFEVGSATTKVESFPFHYDVPLQWFSPRTYRAVIFTTGGSPHNSELLVVDIRNSEVLLRATGSYQYTSIPFYSTTVAASTKDRLLIWDDHSGKYTQRGEF